MKLISALYPFVIFLLLLALGPIFLIYTGHGNLLIPEFWGLFAFISGLTLIVIVSILVGQRVNPEMYAQFFLAGTVFKLLACLVFMMVFLLKHHVNKGVFTGDFFYLYFANTGFEVYVLLCNLRNQNLK